MNKRETAEYLNLSTRAVERAVARGRLSVRYKKDRHGNIALFDPAEVRRYKAELEVPMPRRSTVEPPGPTTPATPGGQANLILGNVVPLENTGSEDSARMGEPFVPIADKLTLSLAEASSLSGLSREFLLQSIRDHRLKAFQHAQDWRIKRADLDIFVQNL